MNPYRTDDDIRVLRDAVTFEELLFVVMRIAARMPQPLGMVCGPITSGGLGSVEKNLDRFQKSIAYMHTAGLSVLDQLIFQDAFFRICRAPHGGVTHLLETFYLPLFKSGFVKILFFIPGWESSTGACWERAKARELRLCVVDIPIERLP